MTILEHLPWNCFNNSWLKLVHKAQWGTHCWEIHTMAWSSTATPKFPLSQTFWRDWDEAHPSRGMSARDMPTRPLHEVNSKKYRFQEITVTHWLLFLRLIITLVVEQGDAINQLHINGRRHHPVNFWNLDIRFQWVGDNHGRLSNNLPWCLMAL